MHPTRLEYYKNGMFGDKPWFVSCFLATKLHADMPIGTPCLAWVEPFHLGNAAIDSYYDTLPRDMIEKKLTMEELLAMKLDPYMITDLIHKSVGKIYIVHLFPTSALGKREYYTHQIATNNTTIIPLKPLIYDEGTIINIAEAKDMFDEVDDVASKFPTFVINMLKDTRYVTYILNNVTRNVIKNIGGACSDLINALRRHLPESVLTMQTNTSTVRSLYDTVVISFYHIDDMIAVFDRSKVGIAMEMYLTNSVWSPGEMVEKSSVFRFLFSKSRENLFTIDGESIKRQMDAPVGDAKEVLNWIFAKHFPVSLEESKKEKNKERKTPKELPKELQVEGGI